MELTGDPFVCPARFLSWFRLLHPAKFQSQRYDRYFSGGTGSYPLVPHGWQCRIRLVAIRNPLRGP